MVTVQPDLDQGKIAVRSTETGHRLIDARTAGLPPGRTRDIRPLWALAIIAPLEIAARWRARLEGRFG